MRATGLGRYSDLVPGSWAPAQGFANHRLTHASAVENRCIEECTAGINRLHQRLHTQVLIKAPTFVVHFDDRVVLRRHPDEGRADTDYRQLQFGAPQSFAAHHTVRSLK